MYSYERDRGKQTGRLGTGQPGVNSLAQMVGYQPTMVASHHDDHCHDLHYDHCHDLHYDHEHQYQHHDDSNSITQWPSFS